MSLSSWSILMGSSLCWRSCETTTIPSTASLWTSPQSTSQKRCTDLRWAGEPCTWLNCFRGDNSSFGIVAFSRQLLLTWQRYLCVFTKQLHSQSFSIVFKNGGRRPGESYHLNLNWSAMQWKYRRPGMRLTWYSQWVCVQVNPVQALFTMGSRCGGKNEWISGAWVSRLSSISWWSCVYMCTCIYDRCVTYCADLSQLIYNLLSLTYNSRIRVKTYADELTPVDCMYKCS